MCDDCLGLADDSLVMHLKDLRIVKHLAMDEEGVLRRQRKDDRDLMDVLVVALTILALDLFAELL